MEELENDIDTLLSISTDNDIAIKSGIEMTRKPLKLHRKNVRKSTYPLHSTTSDPQNDMGDPLETSFDQSLYSEPFTQKQMEIKSASWSHLPVLKTGQLSPSELVDQTLVKEEAAKIIQRAYRLHLIRIHFIKIKELNFFIKDPNVTHPPTKVTSIRESMSQLQLLKTDSIVNTLETIPQSVIIEIPNTTILKSVELVELVQLVESPTSIQVDDIQMKIDVFNKKPKECIKLFSQQYTEVILVEEIANFLNSNITLDKARIGELLGEPDELYLRILKQYVSLQHFKNLSFEDALRLFMQKFKLQGEAQKIDRIMNEFATQFCTDNPSVFKSPVTAYVLAFSTIMLNTDAHNQNIKKKMTLQEFLRNNRGIDEGKDLNDSFLKKLYFDIKFSEIKMNDNDQRALDIWNNIVPKPIVL